VIVAAGTGRLVEFLSVDVASVFRLIDYLSIYVVHFLVEQQKV